MGASEGTGEAARLAAGEAKPVGELRVLRASVTGKPAARWAAMTLSVPK